MNLLELMLSLTLSSFLMGTAWMLYAQIHRQCLAIESILQQANDLILIKHLLKKSIAQAGSTPCLPLSQLNLTPAILPFEAQDQQLILRKMGEAEQNVTRLSSDLLLTQRFQKLKKNQAYLVSDCYQAQIIKLSAVYCHKEHCQLSITPPLPESWSEPIRLSPLITERFYLKPGHGLMFKSKQAALLSKHILFFTAKAQANRIQITLKTKSLQTTFTQAALAA